MRASVTKSFEFSASYSLPTPAGRSEKVLGHNYVLRATFQAEDASQEHGLDEKINQALIQKMHSRDFGLHVDFLKNVSPSDLSRLKVFWRIITEATRPTRLQSLCLERDRHTQWTLNAD